MNKIYNPIIFQGNLKKSNYFEINIDNNTFSQSGLEIDMT